MQEPKIIYEDENFLAVDKPAGLLVHGARFMDYGSKNFEPRTMNYEPTLVDWLVERYPEIKGVGDPVKLPNGNYGAGDPNRPGIVHRLDRGTSGVMLVARNQKYFEYLKSLFQKHEIKKTYLALVRGELKEKHGIIDRPLGIKSGTTKRTVHSAKMAKSAVTEYSVLRSSGGCSLLEVRPRTGRTHQIRVHLASIGHPVVGDKLYGPKKLLTTNHSPLTTRLMLHALAIEFTTVEGRRIKIEADPPPEFLQNSESLNSKP